MPVSKKIRSGADTPKRKYTKKVVTETPGLVELYKVVYSYNVPYSTSVMVAATSAEEAEKFATAAIGSKTVNSLCGLSPDGADDYCEDPTSRLDQQMIATGDKQPVGSTRHIRQLVKADYTLI